MPSNQDEGNALLDEILENEMASERVQRTVVQSGPPTEPESTKKQSGTTYTQWALGGNGRFMPVGATAGKLPAGIYEPFAEPGMWGLEHMNISSDGIYQLPDMATIDVLDEVQRFWQNEAKYRAHNLLYKRGLILWGPPGGGKTVTVKLLMNELVKQDGIVVLVSNVNLAILVLKAIRRVEPERRLIVVFEDIDEIIGSNGEALVLSMLDGENNIDRVLNLATTNYPELLGARIINRPSRFDRRIHVGMPGNEARRDYLCKTTNNGLSVENLDKWVTDTNGMSIAHLRELVAAVYCLDQPYDDVLKRLIDMAKQPTGESGFKSQRMGYKNQLVAGFGG